MCLEIVSAHVCSSSSLEICYLDCMIHWVALKFIHVHPIKLKLGEENEVMWWCRVSYFGVIYRYKVTEG